MSENHSAPQTPSLPADWRPERDLIVLRGYAAAPVGHLLVQGGQQRVIAYELSDLTSEHEGVTVVRSPHELARAIMSVQGEPPTHVSLRYLTGDKLEGQQKTQFEDTIRQAIYSRTIMRNTLDMSGRAWAVQELSNLARVAAHPTAAQLYGRFAGKPCVIVSPGPSLERNIHLLADLEGRALVMTCPHALPILKRAGVRPDMVVAVDAKSLEWQYGDYPFEDVPALVLSPTVHPDLWAKPSRHHFSFSSCPVVDGWILDRLGHRAQLESGGSVACTELSLAVALGCDPIMLAGQDLAFEGDRYYAGDTLDGNSKVCLAEDGEGFVLARSLRDENGAERFVDTVVEKTLEVPGVRGGMVRTSISFDIFRGWISSFTQSLNGAVRVLNCTEGGAYIDGLEHLSLEDAMGANLGDVIDVTAVLEEATEGWDAGSANAKLGELATEMVERFDSCGMRAKRCKDIARQLARRPGDLEKLSRAERELSKALAEAKLLSFVAQEEIRAAEEAGTAATTLEDNLRASQRLYRVVEEAAALLSRPLTRSRNELCRRAERSGAPS